jgi:hypothetical protein
MSSLRRSPRRLDLTAWEKMLKPRMRMTTMEETPPHPLLLWHPLAPAPPAAIVPEEIVMEEDPVEMVLEQEAPVAHEVILANAEPEML